MTDRKTLADLTSDDLGHLYDRLDKLAQTVAAFPDANDAANLAHARAQRDTFLTRAQRAESELQQYSEADSADAAAGSYAHRAEHAEAVIERVRAALDGPASAVLWQTAMTEQLAEEQRLYRLRTEQWRRTVQARDQHTAAINRVRALHQPMQRGALTICAHCSHWDEKRQRCLGVLTDYPCDTLHALAAPAPGTAPAQTTEGSCSPPAAETEPNNPAGLREQIRATIESEIYEYRERTMFWEEGGITTEIARLATRGAMEALDSTRPPAAAWTPPPPGSTREQLPDHILDIARPDLTDYLSTACQTADVVACAACYPRSGVPRPQYDELREHAERLHNRCRLNHKFTGQLCVCGCHPTEETP
jgi:hypothetical protein